jgi:hypothetical protein
MFCLYVSILTYLAGVVIFHDLGINKFLYLPTSTLIEFPNKVSVAPMILIEGNWTCQSTLSEHNNIKVVSEMSEDSEWWNKCYSNKLCRITNTWMSEEYNEDGIKTHHRYVMYNYKKVVKSIVKSSGYNSQPVMPVLKDYVLKPYVYYNFTDSLCMARFKFRNVLTGEYYVESSVNKMVIKSLMKYINVLFEVTYYNKCNFNSYIYIVNDMTHCIVKLKPLNITSYDLHNKL